MLAASKRAGAEWAKANLEPSWRELIERSWATRPVPEVSVRTPADPDDYARTIELVRQAVENEDRLLHLNYPD
jgi:hypothetical protein